MNRAARKRIARSLEQGRRVLTRMSAPGDLAARAQWLDQQQYVRSLEILQAGGDPVEVAWTLASSVWEATQRVESEAPKATIACASGCAWCCHQAVQVSPLDAVGVAHYTQGRAVGELADYRQRLEAEYGRNSKALKGCFWPCPLLDREQGVCTVYPARPIVCRAYHSADADACRRGLDQRSRRDIPMNLVRFGMLGLPQEGALRALDEAGVDRRAVVLGSALALLQEDFRGQVAGWLNGEAVFESVIVERSP